MSDRVVVLGAGYAGCVAIQTLERELDDADLTWVSDVDYHLVLHEVHRAIRDPAVREKITIPVEDLKAPSTSFVRGTVVGVDTDARRIAIDGADDVDYDYLLVALGSDTAFYGIPGVEERAHTLNGLDDALAIHEAVLEAGQAASQRDPARVVVGGAGLSGIQSAGEVAELRDHEGLPVEVVLVEALEEVMPGFRRSVQRRIRRMLEARGIEVLTDDPVTEAGPAEIHFDERSPMPYDVLVWTGGITGREAFERATIENDHQRLVTDATFRTSDDRVFAVGDAA
ncbi:MAG TPA: FAD-dependent oxidoreductase, partial [Halobacteriales archaeon]|nr:FAD-dependent oxidoreductase [Halobacteriales archaeon]